MLLTLALPGFPKLGPADTVRPLRVAPIPVPLVYYTPETRLAYGVTATATVHFRRDDRLCRRPAFANHAGPGLYPESNAALAQAEPRFDVYWRLGAVVFGGVGTWATPRRCRASATRKEPTARACASWPTAATTSTCASTTSRAAFT